MDIRTQIEQNEHKVLSEKAAFSDRAERYFAIPDDPIRTAYQRDKDRILHCKSFRRLKHKTQVFLSPEGDHYRTRMTHTLEVSQIGRTIARALFLNEDLVEACCMGHDLGHTPFGHAGEFALNDVCSLGFNHTEQSVRVVTRLEHNGEGLNLCKATIDGIACHSKGKVANTLEGQIVRFADKIAYMNHDIDDAISGGIIAEKDIPFEIHQNVGCDKSERITAFVMDLIENTDTEVKFSESMQKYFDTLKAFMFESVYRNPNAKGEEGKAKDMLKSLYDHFVKEPDKLPKLYKDIMEKEGKERAVCDYIAGMTDNFAVDLYKELYIPKSWGGKI